jgi:hypothetical protein
MPRRGINWRHRFLPSDPNGRPLASIERKLDAILERLQWSSRSNADWYREQTAKDDPGNASVWPPRRVNARQGKIAGGAENAPESSPGAFLQRHAGRVNTCRAGSSCRENPQANARRKPRKNFLVLKLASFEEYEE